MIWMTCTGALVLSAPGQAQTLTFAADEWCPVNCGPDAKAPGYMIEIAKAILEPRGYRLRYEQITWARALLMTRSGHFDGIYASTPGEAKGFVFPSEAQGQYRIGLFVRKDDPWRYLGPSSLDQKSVGVIIDYSYGEDIDRELKDHSELVQTGGTHALEQNIKTLLAGRLNMVVEDINTFAYKANELGLSGEFRLAKAFEEDDLFIALSPAKAQSHEIAQALSDGMADLRRSGELDRILKKYGLSDWNPFPDEGAHAPKTD